VIAACGCSNARKLVSAGTKECIKTILECLGGRSGSRGRSARGPKRNHPAHGHGVERWRRLSQGLLVVRVTAPWTQHRAMVTGVPQVELCVRECGADQSAALAALVYCFPCV
jgi:hypothetical protein